MKDGNKMTFSTLFNTIYLSEVPVLLEKRRTLRRLNSFDKSHFAAAFIEKSSRYWKYK